MRMSDQSAAIKLAICDDIGERSYDVTDVLVQMLSKLLPTAIKGFLSSGIQFALVLDDAPMLSTSRNLAAVEDGFWVCTRMQLLKEWV
ncbi:hypothetical protein Hdeb2414_s0644g00928931 [Helianthus debilis subsp. tardiflorus]